MLSILNPAMYLIVNGFYINMVQFKKCLHLPPKVKSTHFFNVSDFLKSRDICNLNTPVL